MIPRARVELLFHVDAVHDKEVTIRCDVDANAAEALLDILETGLAAPQQWAASVLRLQWPKFNDLLSDFLNGPAEQKPSKMQLLRSRIDEIFPDP